MSDNYIMRESGRPFKSMAAARAKCTTLKKTGVRTRPIEVEGGFALEIIQKKRPKRKTLGKRNVLTFKVPDGYRGRVVSDVKDRIRMFEEAGWRVYKSDEELGDERVGEAKSIGSAVSKSVSAGVTGVLMIKPEDEFQEDYKDRQEAIDEWESNMNIKPKQDDVYGDVKIRSGPSL